MWARVLAFGDRPPNCRGMKTLQAPIQPAAMLAQLLERLDASRQPFDAHQYRTVAARLAEMLSDGTTEWSPLLEQSRAAAELYENQHYAEAGLCRSPLDAAMNAEVAARTAIEVARRRQAPGSAEPGATAV